MPGISARMVSGRKTSAKHHSDPNCFLVSMNSYQVSEKEMGQGAQVNEGSDAIVNSMGIIPMHLKPSEIATNDPGRLTS